MTEEDRLDTDNGQCEYCNCILHFPFNRIMRHSQPETLKHKQGNIQICNDCIHSMYLKGDLAIDGLTWQFKEDIFRR